LALSAYKYESEDGNTYQVLLPSDFAFALNYAAASGSESYLPSFIAPRYATYFSVSAKISLSVIVTKPAVFANLPQTITISGVSYALVAGGGEQRNSLPTGAILTCAGPQGPKGDTGSLSLIQEYSAVMASDITLTPANTPITLITLNVPSGKYLVNAFVTFLTGATAGDASIWVTTTSAPTTAQAGSSAHIATTGAYWNASTSSYLTRATGGDLLLIAQSTTANAVAKQFNQAGHYGTRIEAIRIGD
jgi:hypothetical protein